MGEVGKELLRERIKNKRASEGLSEVPEDLFAKKPRYDLSDDERHKQDERRKRNKEAAEKSRKKKKEEFEKIQSENDQLSQDKCEMAAMIEKLKQDMNSVLKENQGLRVQNETLKRWIGKRASKLGLSKHVKKNEELIARRESSGSPLLRGNPSLHSIDNGMVSDSEEQSVRSDSPASTHSPKSASPAPPILDFQPVGIRTAARSLQLQTPWIVDQPAVSAAMEKRSANNQEDEVIFTSVPPVPQPAAQQIVTLQESQPAPQASVEEQQVVYHLPKDTILIVQGNDGQQVVMGAPAEQQVAIPLAQQMQTIAMAMPEVQTAEVAPSNDVTIIHGDVNDNISINNKAADAEVAALDRKSSVADPSVVTAIESLLKLGYKIEVPPATEPEAAAKAAPTTVTADHSYEAPEVITVPADTPESATTVTVTTTADSITTSSTSTTSSNPLMNRQLTQDVINKLRERGVVLTLPTSSA